MARPISRAHILAVLSHASKHAQWERIAARDTLGFTNPSMHIASPNSSHSVPSRHLLSQRRLSEKQLRPRWKTKSTRLIHTTPEASADARTRNSDPNAVAVVIGASRGIGLAITQKLVTRWKGRIVATCREPSEAGALSALWQFMPDRFSVVQLDVEDETSIQDAAKQVKEWVEENRVDLLMHTAGLLHEGNNMPETSLSRVRADWLQKNLTVNLVGPVLVAKHFAPMMTTARKEGRVPSVLATLSARVGSISDNSLGGWLSYRASKAGQNQAMKTISIELARRGVICAALHPGTVATDLSAPFRKNVKPEKLFAVDDAAGWLLDVVDSLEMEDTGGFFAYDRQPIPF